VLDALAGAGVQRLSVGVQTFDDRLLGEMLRLDKYGSRAEILEHLAAAAGRFRTLNLDMIWDLPHQTRAMLEADLDDVLASPANQASFYPLMVSSSTRRRIAKTLGARGGARTRRWYDLIVDRMQPAFEATSAWCFTRGGGGIDEYLVKAPRYVGLGSGAFSYLDGRLYATTFSVQAYVERIERGLSGVTAERGLSPREALRYELMLGLMGLRLPKDEVRARHGGRFERELRAELLALRAAGAIVDEGAAWSLTPRGRYLWVRMMGAFFESVDELRESMRRRVRDDLGDTSAEAVSFSGSREPPEKGVDQVRAVG
jgi:coproporphyrinogen III oxidase-like Fe-S oxidoreductase